MLRRESSNTDLGKKKIIYVFYHQALDIDSIFSLIKATNQEKEMGNINLVINFC